jgi:hypothetical protein
MKYVIIKNNGSCGICGYIWQVLRAIWHNPDFRYYVDFSYGCQYGDDSVKETDNVWEYYFKQPGDSEYPPEDQVEKTIDEIINVPESEFRDVFMVDPTPEYISNRRHEFNDIINKHIKLQPSVESKIQEFVDRNFTGKRVLGVHFRGTDHPDKKNVFEYFQTIKDKAANYDLIFCASDEAERINALITVFGDKVVTYNSLRSESAEPLHYSDKPKFRIGEDVIIEAYLLSKTDFLFCCSNSNVNYLSRAINPTLESQAL